MFLCVCSSCFNFVTHLPEYVQTLFVHADHPLSYNFTIYDQLLKEVVKDDLVDYAAVKKSKLLDQAVSELARTSPEDLEDDTKKLCFWINAYNLCVLKALADKYPGEIMKTDGRVVALDTTIHIIGGKTYKLDIMRASQVLPRIKAHPFTLFLVCDGMRGAPPLLNHALEEKSFVHEGKEAFFKYIKDKHNVLWNPLSEILCLSPFFKWNEIVWGPNTSPGGAVIQYMPQVGEPDVERVMFVKYNLPFNYFLNDINLKIVSPKKATDKSSKSDSKSPPASDPKSPPGDSKNPPMKESSETESAPQK